MTNEEKINLIGQKILVLSNDLDKSKNELQQLKQQLDALRQQQPIAKQESFQVPPFVKTEPIPQQIIPEVKQQMAETKIQEPVKPLHEQFNIPLNKELKPKPKSNFNAEQFVGGKLITIIGIAILVIGIGIGVKYAIDKDLLGPLARIVLAYLAGAILLGLALKLKAKYKPFSAVLLSGAMASLYFTTFAGYSMYQLFPQMAAFAIMVVFTAFTVFAATVYNLEVIGVIGLVGAYAVPMLLSDGTGKIEVMFIYMLIINIGILILSFKKYWQWLNHFSYGFTWLIVSAWFFGKYQYELHSLMALSFTFLFFLIFYINNMSYKIMKKEKFGVFDIIRIVTNSFIFFGFGYYALNNKLYESYLGLFTVANALIHLVFSYIVFRNKLLDRKLFYLLIALVLSFITIAVPVQLEAHWVTLFWSVEAVLLFTIGRYKAVRFYEWLGYVMILLAVFSLVHNWATSYYGYFEESLFKFWNPFFNMHIFTSLFVSFSIGTIIFVHHKKEIPKEIKKEFVMYTIFEYVLPILLLLISYFAFSNEINASYESMYQKSLIQVPSKEVWAEKGAIMDVYDYIYLNLKDVVLGMYNLFFFSVLSILAIKRWKDNMVRWVVFGLNLLAVTGFLFWSLHELATLRDSYLLNEQSEYYTQSSVLLYLRYVSFALFAILLWLTNKLLKTETFNQFTISKIYSGCIVHLFILAILSNELMNINHILSFGTDANYLSVSNTYKFGFTIIWGVYSFVLIAIGIFRKNKVLRISSISLFGFTILKLLLVDTDNLSTGYKVVAYMMLGAILLLVAFLYQKFKVLIFDDDEQNKDETITNSEI